MRQLNAFVTPEYPVLYDVERPEDETDGSAPEGVGVGLALLVKGIPAFLATHVVPREELKSILTSLDAGDVRVAVVGLPVQMKPRGEEAAHHPAAFVSLLCADGRRVTVARVVGSRDDESSSQELARHVSKQIARGVQISELVSL